MSDLDIFTLGGEAYAVAVPCSGKSCCDKCMFSVPGKHECKAGNLMDAGVLPVCDEDGIGYNCYYRKPTAQEAEDYMEEDKQAKSKEKPKKLTAEIFEESDMPPWAEYAAVDDKGTVYVFDVEPVYTHGSWYLCTRMGSRYNYASNGFDSSDPEHSLVQRQPQLPAWCSAGEWVYDKRNKDYIKLMRVERMPDGQYGLYSDGDGRVYSEGRFVQAAMRPFRAKDMRELVGKVVVLKGNLHLVTDFEQGDEGCHVRLGSVAGWFTAEDLLEQGVLYNHECCGILVHLSEDEWVR